MPNLNCGRLMPLPTYSCGLFDTFHQLNICRETPAKTVFRLPLTPDLTYNLPMLKDS
ncbi:hypothetical protein CROQUDRAFT_660593 [Cronartium quercuum f. sp. fusiforme G11]|uniref:Uncharacterized protein n=1 Tax=Cronartium quercuum f. sp. fusiforme G11 TaxID=708437 RepID=A0A9P6T9V3_9BASI|nr:hypothetical protein CROQUDRAFT_660593 [Cronartium quercuum f. sp. fusiforme G11]